MTKILKINHPIKTFQQLVVVGDSKKRGIMLFDGLEQQIQK